MPVRSVFKSLVLRGDAPDVYAVVVLAGDARLDLARAAAVLGWRKASFADPAEALARTGYPTGGTPPVGHRHALPVVVDDALPTLGVGYAGGGLPERLLRIDATEIVRLTGAHVERIRR